MKNILKAPFLVEATKLLSNSYRLGWDERNGGNLSYLLKEEDYKGYISGKVIRTIPLNFYAPELVGKVYLVTGTGKYFRNVEADPENNMGIIRIAKDGETAELLWGFKDGGKFTSELPAHLMTHISRLSVDPNQRVVMHCHPTYTIAMTISEELDSKSFTQKLWRANTEDIVVFPEGVSVIPWCLCGTNEIGQDTANRMKDFRVVIWAIHGTFGVGSSLDEAFGLIETVEKTAQIYMISKQYGIKNTITDEGLLELAKFWHVEDKIKDGWLSVK